MSNPKIYQLYGVDTAVQLLRPGARWELTNSEFSLWEDERPCPTMEEIKETMEKIKKFEDSINTIWTKKQLEEVLGIQNNNNGEEVVE